MPELNTFEAEKKRFIRREFSTDLGVMMTEKDQQTQLKDIKAMEALDHTPSQKVDLRFMKTQTLREIAKSTGDREGKKKLQSEIVKIAEDKNCTWGRPKLSASQLLFMKDDGVKWGGVTTNHGKAMEMFKSALDLAKSQGDEETQAMAVRSAVRWATGKDSDIYASVGKKALKEVASRPECIVASVKVLNAAIASPGARNNASINAEKKLYLTAWRASPAAKMLPNVKTADDLCKLTEKDIVAAYAKASPQTVAKRMEGPSLAAPLSRSNNRQKVKDLGVTL